MPDLDGVLIDANLAWRASALTTFLFTAQSTFIDSIAVGSSQGSSWPSANAWPSLALTTMSAATPILFGRYQHIAFDW